MGGSEFGWSGQGKARSREAAISTLQRSDGREHRTIDLFGPALSRNYLRRLAQFDPWWPRLHYRLDLTRYER